MIRATKILLESTTVEGRSVPYYREDPKAGYVEIDNIASNAMFVDLQKLNIDNIESVRRFVERYGVPQLGCYGALFRLSRHSGKRHSYPIGIAEGIGGVERDCCRLHHPFTGCFGYRKGTEDLIAVKHFAKSEAVRRLNYHSKKAPELPGGIIAVAEAQYVLRLLQNGSAILAARDCFNGDAIAMTDYLLEDIRPQSKCVRVESQTPVFLYQHLDSSETVRSSEDVNREIARWSLSEEDAEERRRVYAAWREADVKHLVNEVERFFAAVARASDVRESGPSAEELLAKALEDPAFAGFETDDSTTVVFAKQFEVMCSSDDPWRICENPRCKNLFKRQREYSPDSNRRFKPSKYCSNSCRVSAQHKPADGF